MRLSHTFFCICLGIILGITASVYDLPFLQVLLVCTLVILIGLFLFVAGYGKAYALACVIPALCMGAGFLYADAWASREYAPLQFGREVSIEGTVRLYPRLSDFGKGFVLATEYGNLQVYTGFSREAEYGDEFTVQGEVSELSQTQQYLKKDLVQGIIKNPEIISYQKGRASLIRSLYRIRAGIRDTFVKMLPYDEASLATGFLIGGGSISFSQELKTAMQNSGTTHIIALSGYNISIILVWVYAFFGFFVPRSAAFWATCGFVVLFTLMTGAEASIVRAAIMGLLLITSQHLGRVYSFRQSVAAVGCLMLVANPYAIRYDAGFTLSFLSLFGITYIAPLLMYPFSKFRWTQSEAGKAGFQTIAAQLAVLPVLIHLFEGFSPLSILANSFILPIIPVAMLLSFFAGTVGVLSLAAGEVLAFVARPVLQYVLELVRVFGSAEQVPFSKSWFLTCAYYAALVAVIAYGKRKIPKII